MAVDNNSSGSHKPLTFMGRPEAVAGAKKLVLEWLAAERAKWGGGGGEGLGAVESAAVLPCSTTKTAGTNRVPSTPTGGFGLESH